MCSVWGGDRGLAGDRRGTPRGKRGRHSDGRGGGAFGQREDERDMTVRDPGARGAGASDWVRARKEREGKERVVQRLKMDMECDTAGHARRGLGALSPCMRPDGQNRRRG